MSRWNNTGSPHANALSEHLTIASTQPIAFTLMLTEKEPLPKVGAKLW
jgi:hypothetical protein